MQESRLSPREADLGAHALGPSLCDGETRLPAPKVPTRNPTHRGAWFQVRQRQAGLSPGSWAEQQRLRHRHKEWGWGQWKPCPRSRHRAGCSRRTAAPQPWSTARRRGGWRRRGLGGRGSSRWVWRHKDPHPSSGSHLVSGPSFLLQGVPAKLPSSSSLPEHPPYPELKWFTCHK